MEKEYDDYWKTVIDTMLEGVMLVDPDGRIIFVNRAFEEISGYRSDEVVGKGCEIMGCDTCFGSRADGEGKYCALFREGKVDRRKCIFQKKDGTLLHVLKNAATIQDAHGTVIGGVENLTDLTPVIARDEVISDLRCQLQEKDIFHGIIGKSRPLQQVFDLIESAAASEAPVIIYGESGTGKELVAGAIHQLGTRRKGPYVKVNCASLNENLLESELFGHVKGAFTGADFNRVGRFEAAHGGDLFLDEIGDLPLATQTKLLRVLQEKEFERVGDNNPVSVDVRIIAATNKNLEKMLKDESFRVDLFYRIGVIPIVLPPLRERQADIPILVEAFIKRLQLKTAKAITGIGKEAMRKLMEYRWPGNVRELMNAIEYAFVLCKKGIIHKEHLPVRVLKGNKSSVRDGEARFIDNNEKERVLAALRETGGNRSAAANLLGISRVTLWKRLKKYGIGGSFQDVQGKE